MPGTDTYDYTQDPEFLAASPDRQHSYLLANDPEYAQAHPDQQRAYLGHVNGGQYTEKGAASNPPIAGVTATTPQKGVSGTPYEGKGSTGKTYHAPVNPLGVHIGMQEAEEPSSRAIGRATGTIGALAPAMVSPVTTAGALAGGMAGAPLVSSGARGTVRALGGGQEAQDTAGTIGGYAGAFGGGLLGGGAGALFEGLPEETSLFGAKFRTPNFLRKSPFEPSEGYSNPLGPDKGEFEAQHEAQLLDQGKLVKIPNKVKPPFEQKPPLPTRAKAEMEQDILEGRQARAAARDVAHEDLAQARMRRGREQQQIEEGAPVEGSTQKPVVVPEPNPVGPGEKPGAQWSVKRPNLVQNAKRAKEGAGTVLNQISGPVLYEPRGVVGATPRTPEQQATMESIGKGPIGKGPAESAIKTGITGEENGKVALHAQLEKDTGINVHDLVDKFQEKNPNMPRGTAYDLAEKTLRNMNSPNSFEREQAQNMLYRITGPERRGPDRLGPEFRGVK